MKQRKLIIGLLVTLAVAVSGFTFAFWSNIDLSDEIASTSVTIGEGRQASFTAALDAAGTGTLVPSGEQGNSISPTPVESVTFTFNVEWSDNAFTGGTADLTVSVGNISNATAELYLDFSDVTAPATLTEGAAPVTVTIVVTLDEPDNETDYLAIINGTVTFDVTFSIDNLTTA